MLYYFQKIINVVSILYYTEFITEFIKNIFIEFIKLLYTLLLISFVRYKEYMILPISFSKFSDVLPAFNCARVIANL